MSGFVGIVNTDGAPVNQDQLSCLTRFMAYRGPDGQSVWSSGNVGLGNAKLSTATESEHEQQPISFDEEVWITADARIDGRDELLGKLKAEGTKRPGNATNAQLILRAYEAWGERCIQHLIGDFSFIIWDGKLKKIFCACDHFGVKPFFYARTNRCLIISNTLACIKKQAGVSAKLNDLAVADFLLFDFNQEADTTTFRDIQRLPPAHALHWSAPDGLSIKRYWRLPVDGHTRYRRTSDYVEHYRELLDKAVGDRLPTKRVAVFMSGGLDSTSVAASAARTMSKNGGPAEIRAYTAVYDHLMPDRERYFSTVAAQALDISIEFLPLDDFKLYQNLDLPGAIRAEPVNEPLIAILMEQLRQVMRHCRIILTGHGGDAVFRMSAMQFFSRQFGKLLLNSLRYATSYGRVPKIGVRSGLRKLFGNEPAWLPDYPCWLEPGFEKRMGLRERWDFVWKESPAPHAHRPEAYSSLESPIWRSIFEFSDPGETHFPVEFRHPLFDTRLVTYLLSLPNEVFFDKDLVRLAMRDRLPREVWSRPKTPLVDSPLRVRSAQYDELMRDFRAVPQLAEYVDASAIPRRAAATDDGNSIWVNLRAVSLNHWLRCQKSIAA